LKKEGRTDHWQIGNCWEGKKQRETFKSSSACQLLGRELEKPLGPKKRGGKEADGGLENKRRGPLELGKKTHVGLPLYLLAEKKKGKNH